ncbi:hypothetical protein ACET3X_002250 [Alternaria dauci]|uniref:Nephrocystin 3-like N-terminal domain-containing protein n=1 Tax=Alternaria dauci TaxID=48095 RepID=A0ABR3UP18_9PLEO
MDFQVAGNYRSPETEVDETLKWLHSQNDEDSMTIRARASSQRASGTLEWIFETTQFQDWLEDDPSTLLLMGKPGSGKTTAASLVVGKLAEQTVSLSAAIAFIHVGDSPGERTAPLLLQDILYQLGRQSLLLMSYYHMAGEKSCILDLLRERPQPPSLEEMLSQMLPRIVKPFRRVYIVVDNYDQLAGPPYTFLFSGLVSLTQENLWLCLTATHGSSSITIPQKVEVIHISDGDTEQDLDTYVTQRLSTLPDFVRDNSELQAEVKRRVMEDSNGLVFAAKLIMNGLMDTRSPVLLKEQLLSSDFILEPLYSKNMENIRELRRHDQELVHDALAWLLLAKRPLQGSELLHALAVKDGSHKLDSAGLLTTKFLTWLCEHVHFVSYAEINDQLNMHRTASDYLLRTLNTWYPNAQDMVTRCCLTYLSFDEFTKGPCTTDGEFESRLDKYRFYQYATQYWPDHVKSLQNSLPEPLIDSFLTNAGKVASASQAMAASAVQPPQPGYSQSFNVPGSGFHFAAQLGLTSVIVYLLGKEKIPTSPAKIDSKGRTPLWCAIEKNQDQTMKLLARYDHKTFTLLLDKKQTSLAGTLLRAAGPDIRDWNSNTPIHIGVIRKDLAIARLSLESGVDVDQLNADGRSAIQLAVAGQFSDAIDLLLEHSADTAHVSVEDCILGKQGSDSKTAIIELVEDDLKRKKMSLYSAEDFKWANHTIPGTSRRLLVYSDSSFWVKQDPVWRTKHPHGDMFFSSDHHQRLRYGISVSVPLLAQSEDHDPFGVNLKELKISWDMDIYQDLNGNDRWISMDHWSTLNNISMPSSGMAFLQDLLDELTTGWLAYFGQIDTHLLHCHLDVLRANGQFRGLLDRLLKEAATWVHLRRRYQRQVNVIRGLCKTYNTRRFGDDGASEIVNTIEEFASTGESRYDKLERDLATVIQLEFNLTSIRETQKSTSLNLSMKRLSWITFIFLPLTFVSGLFGMYVNVLANNPPWWWYLVFMFGTLGLTISVWIIFRKYPGLEDKMDARFSWLKPRDADRKIGDVESGLSSQEKKVN